MKVIKYPAKEEWKELVKRPHLDVSQLNATVEGVLEDVRNHGDEAVKRYEEKFDHAHLDSLSVSEAEMTKQNTWCRLSLNMHWSSPIITLPDSMKVRSLKEARWKPALVWSAGRKVSPYRRWVSIYLEVQLLFSLPY